MQDLSFRLSLSDHLNAETWFFLNNFTGFLNFFSSVFDFERRPRHSSPSMNRLCNSRTRVRDITLSQYTSFNSWEHSVCQSFSNIARNLRLIALLDFHPSHESGRTTQHGHTQTEIRGKPIDIERQFQSCSIWEASRSITYHLLPTPTSFHGRVRAIPLFYSCTFLFSEKIKTAIENPNAQQTFSALESNKQIRHKCDTRAGGGN
jgi:hypothetical protein